MVVEYVDSRPCSIVPAGAKLKVGMHVQSVII